MSKIICPECAGAGRDYDYAICDICGGEGEVPVLDYIRSLKPKQVSEPMLVDMRELRATGDPICIVGPGSEPIVGIPFGGYVNDPPYKLMRLRMLLTGTNAPDDATWSAALSRLLEHLDKHPMDIAPPAEPDANGMMKKGL